MRLAPGVHAFPQTLKHGTGPVTFHPAAVETPKGVLVIDVGFPANVDRLEAHLRDLGNGWGDVHGIVLTHQDGDHAAALSDVVAQTEATVFAHEEAAPYIDGREEPIKSDGDRYPPADVDVELVDGVRFHTDAGPMEVVFTPGHAPGHISLYFPTVELLLAGDAMTARDGLAGPSGEFTLDLTEATESVGRLAMLDVEQTLCYHGGFVKEGTDEIAAVYETMQDAHL